MTLIKIEGDGYVIHYNTELPITDPELPGGGVRGNNIDYDSNRNIWITPEGKTKETEEVLYKLPCVKCKEKPTEEGHDACLGELPGVKFACCGHGREHGYIAFTNGVVIRGNFYVDER